MIYKYPILLLIITAIVALLPHPAISGDSNSFNPTKVPINFKSQVPIGTIIVWASTSEPNDAEKWLDCDGRSIDKTKFPELYDMYDDHKTPNLTGQFLRGIQSGHNLLENVGDTLKSHTLTIDPHTHGHELKANGTAQVLVNTENPNILGISSQPGKFEFICGQEVKSVCEGPVETKCVLRHNGYCMHWVTTIPCKPKLVDKYCTLPRNKPFNSTDPAISSLDNGTIDGILKDSETLQTTYKGGTETAPEHTYVRYLIRAAQ